MKAYYYEIHITLDPVFDQHLEELKRRANSVGYKVATLLMQKRPEDTPEMSKYDSFMTAHVTTDMQDAIKKCIEGVTTCQNAGFKVRRYKIETVTVDSRNYDLLNLLS